VTHPAIRELLHSLHRQAELQELSRKLNHPGTRLATAGGLTTTAKALVLALLWQSVQRPLLIVVDGNRQAETLFELLSTFHEILSGEQSAPPQLLPALDVLPWQNLSPHSEIAEQRAIGLYRLATGAAPLTVTPVGSALLRTETADAYRQLAIHVELNEDIPLDDFLAHIESIGYERREPVEMVGEYSVRGGIVDVFPAEAARPVRIEMFGDTVESLRTFDPATQRSISKITRFTILPLMETQRSSQILRAAGSENGRPFPGWEFHAVKARPRNQTLFGLAERLLAVVDEPEQVAAAAERFWKRLEEPGRESPVPLERIYLRKEELLDEIRRRQRLFVRELDIAGEGENPDVAVQIASRPSIAFHGNMQVAVAEARNLIDSGCRTIFFAPSTGELERLADIFSEYSMPFQLGLTASEHASPYLSERAYLAGSSVNLYLAKGRVRRGAILTGSRLAIFGSEDLFDTSELVAEPGIRPAQGGAFAADIADLKPGDFVVHATHGIGKFLGVREVQHGERKGDFMLIEYAGEAKLYVPLERMDLIQRYRGAGDGAPALDKLGGATWAKTKSRVKARMRDMAEHLLKLYAERKLAQGYAFSPDSNWQREFEDAFEFVPTKDQLTAAKEIKADMESSQPMDRLLCGDVGFGKTEVAMRAAFKALGDGKQVAVLAPTTVLAFQHYETFKRRFAPFPVRVDLFSRFRSPTELKQSLDDLATGKVDVAIGTHRLLSKDVQFADLGLLVIDEEQRFGVRHKERLKELRKNIDVLTMTATPIPRTLHMSMLGLRDLSVIETPPKDRLAIHTVVAHWDANLVKSAIEQELARGGQVYYLHNRVESIWMRAAMLQEMLPEARIAVGHGQMKESALEQVLLGFMRHEFDVFVCTTIVENGIDIPLANTIIIENAERYGLSELYQLRGRVGRSNRRAYAYLLVPPAGELSEVARKRLAALREFSELGAGFKIAALDLELRGAGNILGGEQHGHINSVGYDMYMQLLQQTVNELRGEKAPLEIHATMNLGLDLRISPEYITEENQRLRAYKRIADVGSPEQAQRVLEELEDRYGAAPEAVKVLLQFSVVKTMAEEIGVESIERRQGYLNIKFHPQAKVDPARLAELLQSNPQAQFTPAGVLRWPVPAAVGPGAVLEELEVRLRELASGVTVQ
jgi:transcription-repair coupling factor (superfamily II helicase)